jgi:hypothetical protein
VARIKIIGQLPKHSALIVGAWDPLLPEIERRVATLKRQCERRENIEYGRLTPVLLDPSPGFILAPHSHPYFECGEARVSRLLTTGVTGVIRVSLSKTDCKQGIKWLHEILSKYTTISSLFLGPKQSLGSSGQGDRHTVVDFCSATGVALRDSRVKQTGLKRKLYELYAQREFAAIATILGRPLSWVIRRDNLKIPLAHGRYSVRYGSTLESTMFSYCPRTELVVDVNQQANLSTCRPSSAVWIGIMEQLNN